MSCIGATCRDARDFATRQDGAVAASRIIPLGDRRRRRREIGQQAHQVIVHGTNVYWILAMLNSYETKNFDISDALFDIII